MKNNIKMATALTVVAGLTVAGNLYAGNKTVADKKVASATPVAGVDSTKAIPDSIWKSENLNEVVVTTQKRAQSSVEVPFAVSAMTGGNLGKLNIYQMDELANFTPGVQIQLQSPNNPSYVIRGVTSDDGAATQQPRVSVFLDGVSTTTSRASAVELFDMERVEVAKGPQGTLFGRGAEVGGISMIRNKAVNRWAGEILANYGSYNKRQVTGFLNIPVVKDKFADRIAFDYDARDGFIKDIAGGRLNGKEAIAVRNSMKFWLGENTDMDFIVDYQHDNYPGTSFRTGFSGYGVDPDPNKPANLEMGKELGIKRNVGGGTLLFNHTFNDALKLTSITGFRAFDSDEKFDADGTALPLLNAREREHGTQYSEELRLNYTKDKIAGFVGASIFHENLSQDVDAKTNLGYLYPVMVEPKVKATMEPVIDKAAAQISAMKAMIPAPYQGQVDQVVAALNGLKTKWFTGQPVTAMPDFYTDLSTILTPLLQLQGQLTGQTLDFDTYLSSQEGGAKTLAALKALSKQSLGEYTEEGKNYGTNTATDLFADFAYKFTPAFTLTAGLRGTYEHQESGYSSTTVSHPLLGMMGTDAILYHPTENAAKVSTSKDYWSWVGRLALNYMFGRNNVYASVSRGRRPGQIYYNNSPKLLSNLKPEIILSYEVGIKGNILNNRLAYDLCAYYYDWYHYQTNSFDPQLSLYVASDAGRAHSFGVEASLSYKLTNWLRVFGNYSFIDGKFNDEDQDGNKQEYAGNRFRLTPKNTFSVGLDINKWLNTTSIIFFRPTYTYKSKVFFNDDNYMSETEQATYMAIHKQLAPELSQKGYGICNFNLGWRYQPKDVYYEVSVFGKNIFDEKYIVDAGNSGRNIYFPTYIGGTRSVIGLQLKVGF